MEFTFGIITNGEQKEIERVHKIIDSIEAEQIPVYEVIVLNSTRKTIDRKHTITLPFEQPPKIRAWITKMKNMITELSLYENIVYMHDYIALVPGWYQGHLEFGDDFIICMDKMLNADGSRFRDWTLNPMISNIANLKCLLPYDVTDLTKYMYISGAYWVGKKSFMLEYPLDEKLLWADGEDMKWCNIINKVIDFSMNVNSTVKIIKEQKAVVFGYATDGMIEHLRRANSNAFNIESPA